VNGNAICIFRTTHLVGCENNNCSAAMGSYCIVGVATTCVRLLLPPSICCCGVVLVLLSVVLYPTFPTPGGL